MRPALLLIALAACGGATPPPGGAAPQGPAAPTPGAASPAPTVDPNLPPANPGPPTKPYEAGGVEGDLEVRQLGAWSQSPYQEPERAVIRDQGALERLWARLGASEDMPKVDFATDVVIVAALGQRPSGGYGISVRRAAVEAGKLTAEVVSVKPGAGCVTTMAMTQPVEVVAVAAAKVGEVGFVEREETKDC
jgi:protease stability complex PrcB-like protein